jgi:hypothetical protein
MMLSDSQLGSEARVCVVQVGQVSSQEPSHQPRKTRSWPNHVSQNTRAIPSPGLCCPSIVKDKTDFQEAVVDTRSLITVAEVTNFNEEGASFNQASL